MKKSNNQSFSEKVAILDESTGQIILKECIDESNTQNQYKSDEDEDTIQDEFSINGSNDEQESCSINFPHTTILSKLEAQNIQPIEVCSPDGKGSFYRCPLCPLSNAYYNIQASKVVDHINGNKHFGIAVKHRSWLICRCDEPLCLEQHHITTQINNDQSQKFKSHRHCPHCGRLFLRRNEFIFHTERCCLSSNSLSVATQKVSNHKDMQQKKQTKHITKLQRVSEQQQQQQNASSNTNNNNYVYLISTQSTQNSITNTSNNINGNSTKRKILHDNDLIDETYNSKSHKRLMSSPMYDINDDSGDEKINIEYLDENNSIQTNETHIILNNKSDGNHSASSATTSGLSAHIVQNYSILAHEITSPLDSDIEVKNWHPKPTISAYSRGSTSNAASSSTSNANNSPLTSAQQTSTSTPSNNQTNAKNLATRAQKDLATCQFCGRAMLKKNIPTHIRRAHTPKEELVCLNEDERIYTIQDLKPGQRRKRAARAYDFSQMTVTVSIDDDPCDGIENKFITEGEEILSTDLLQLADRIKFGITQIPLSTLSKLIDVLTKIEISTPEDISTNAKTIKNMIILYCTSSEEFKYKMKQIGDDIFDKKKQVCSLRSDLKEIMTRKVQLERRIQPIVCELQKLEDQHGNLIESIMHLNGFLQVQVINTDEVDEQANNSNNSNNEDDTESSTIIC